MSRLLGSKLLPLKLKLFRLDPKSLVIISLFLFALWLLLVLISRPTFASAVLSDPLAMINVLFPYYWIILGAFVVLCVFTFLKKDSPRWLHATLLVQLALMLYYTPFLVGGFSWSPDSLWHAGVARYLPSILSGANLPLTEYAQSYPFSFAVTYGAENILQINVVTYTLYVFPPICIALISGLAYFFISRITEKQTAFLSMLIALPALHYIEPHVSPFATGTVLLLASLVLLTYRGMKYVALNVALIVALVLTHPISPLFLGVYIFGLLLFGSTSITFGQSLKRLRLNLILLLAGLGVFWFFWTYFVAAKNYVGITAPLNNVLSLDFLNGLSGAVQFTTGGQGFIFPQIGQLSLLIYAIFGILILTICVTNLFVALRKRRGLQPTSRIQLQLAFTALGSAAIGYLLFSSSGERFLLGRGLLFFLLMGSVCISSFIMNAKFKKPRILTALAIGFIVFLAVTFPVVSYSKEDYNTFTPDSQAVLTYLTTQMDLTNKTISMGYYQQLAAYANLSEGFNPLGFPPDMNLTIQKPDIVVLRLNYYYLLAMRYEFSFTNNSYTRALEYLENTTNYREVFSNDQGQIWVRVMP